MPITFEDPPDPKTGPAAYLISPDDVAALIANTGQWARVADAKTRSTLTNRARKISEGRGNCAGHRWETAVRKIGDLQVLYVRHITPTEH